MNKTAIEKLRIVSDSLLAASKALEVAGNSIAALAIALDSDALTVAEKIYTYEEARAVLAGKARAGFRAEVKALLSGVGAKALSDIKDDPQKLASVVAEAEKLAGDSND